MLARAPAEVHRCCRWADLAQFKRRRGDKKEGGSTARGGKRGAAARVQDGRESVR